MGYNYSMFAVSILAVISIISLMMMIRTHEAKSLKESKLRQANQLYQCKDCKCERYFRYWQYNLHEEMYDECVCVHCGVRVGYLLFDADTINAEKSWLANDRDCRKIDWQELQQQNETIEELRKLRGEEKEMAEYQAYDAKRKVSYWMKKGADQ